MRSAGSFPTDLPQRGFAYDRQRHGPGARVDELSHLPLGRQVTHDGATWLDRTMLGAERADLAQGGFAGDVEAAWDQRRKVLAGRGHVTKLSDGG